MTRTPVLLMGGIGNRLFQMARAVDLQEAGRNPVLVELEALSDLSFVTNRLMGWSVHPMWLDLAAMAADMGLAYGKPDLDERLALFAELGRIRVLGQRDRLNLPMDEDTRRAQIGYFQAPDSLSRKAILTLSGKLNEVLANPAPRLESVLHIRGGDFAMADRCSPADVAAFVQVHGDAAVCVTNDRKFVAAEYPGLRIHGSKSALEDFTAIARARHIMPSNSTFCFWACTVAVLYGGAKVTPGERDPYWRLLAGYSGVDNANAPA